MPKHLWRIIRHDLAMQVFGARLDIVLPGIFDEIRRFLWRIVGQIIKSRREPVLRRRSSRLKEARAGKANLDAAGLELLRHLVLAMWTASAIGDVEHDATLAEEVGIALVRAVKFLPGTDGKACMSNKVGHDLKTWRWAMAATETE